MSKFRLTDHATKRHSQRGYRKDELCFLLEEGSEAAGGFIFTNEDAQRVVEEARFRMKLASKLRGTYVPCAGEAIKTVFKATRSQQARLL